MIGSVKICSIVFGKFATNIEFYIGVHIRFEICVYQKFQIAFLDWCDEFVEHDVGGLNSVLYGFASENAKFAA
jgi:hypothetical protein